MRMRTFLEAAQSGDVARVRDLLDRHPELVNVREEGFPPLYWTALNGYSGRSTRNGPVIDLLLERGAEIDIFAAAYLGRPERAAELLAADAALAGARDARG